MRGSIDGLGSSAPIGAMLPAVFADDDLAQRFVGGLDDVVAPILSVLDCLDTYFRPSLAPLDFTQWLGGWVGAETEGDEPEALLRAAVAAAAYLHRIRGTRRGRPSGRSWPRRRRRRRRRRRCSPWRRGAW